MQQLPPAAPLLQSPPGAIPITRSSLESFTVRRCVGTSHRTVRQMQFRASVIQRGALPKRGAGKRAWQRRGQGKRVRASVNRPAPCPRPRPARRWAPTAGGSEGAALTGRERAQSAVRHAWRRVLRHTIAAGEHCLTNPPACGASHTRSCAPPAGAFVSLCVPRGGQQQAAGLRTRACWPQLGCGAGSAARGAVHACVEGKGLGVCVCRYCRSCVD